MTGHTNSKFYEPASAADYITSKWGHRCSVAWLAKLRVIGGGPTFRKAGRTPIYAEADLDDWAESRISGPMRSTSELAAKQTGR